MAKYLLLSTLIFLPLVIEPATIPPPLHNQLGTTIFGASVLGGPQTTERNIVDPAWPGATIDRLTYEMEFGFVSISYLFHAANPNGWLMIYHEGHDRDFVARKGVIDRLLAEGFDVAALDMPLTGRNNQPTVCLPVQGCVKFFTHSQFALLQPSQGTALRFFLEPVIATQNGPGRNYEHIAMMGLSGGGWTTTLAAALDERIEASFPVAGSLPMRVHTKRDAGDWEQMLQGIAHMVSYEDLYVLATSNGRRQMQVLNLHDPCCFSNDGSAYRDEVGEATGGRWSLFVDEQQRTHDISPAAMEKIINSFVSRETNGW
jgi:hypothetical protein